MADHTPSQAFAALRAITAPLEAEITKLKQERDARAAERDALKKAIDAQADKHFRDTLNTLTRLEAVLNQK